MLHHVNSPHKYEVAFGTLDVQRLPLMGMYDMLFKVGLVPKLLPAQLTHGLLWRRLSGYFSLVLFFVTRGEVRR